MFWNKKTRIDASGVSGEVPTQYMTAAAVAKRWGCSILTVRRRYYSGELPAIKQGRRIRFAYEDVLRLEGADRERGKR